MVKLCMRVSPAPSHGKGIDPSERNVEILLRAGNEVFVLLQALSNLEKITDWFKALETKTDALPPKVLDTYAEATLAESISAFYEKASDELSDSIFEEMLTYRKSHDVRFAFRGSDIPSVVIGTWCGQLTISWSSPMDIPAQFNGVTIELAL